MVSNSTALAWSIGRKHSQVIARAGMGNALHCLYRPKQSPTSANFTSSLPTSPIHHCWHEMVLLQSATNNPAHSHIERLLHHYETPKH